MGVEELFWDSDNNGSTTTHRQISYDDNGFLKIFCIEIFSEGATASTEKYQLSFGHYRLLRRTYLEVRRDRITFEAEAKVLSRMNDEEKNRRIKMLIPNFGDDGTPFLRI